MEILVRKCTVADFESSPNWADLLAEYAKEAALPELGRTSPQMDMYRQIEAAGFFHPAGAFHGYVLAGFILPIVITLPHYGVLAASVESFFVPKTYRRSGVGLKLLAYAESMVTAMGGKAILVSAPAGGVLAQVMPRKGQRCVCEGATMNLVPKPEFAIAPMTAAAVDKVRALERQNAQLEQVPIATAHLIHAGLYARSIMLPAGVVLTGALIKRATVLILDGDVTLNMGETVIRLSGYYVVPASAHRKQVFLAHADTHMTMLFPTIAKDVRTVEGELTDEADLLFSRNGENFITITGE
jgi:GNAT superfamily N-acetyltransferase